mmetsp:Transcript_16700/g.37551  ORF Transcript_16700/g.37551 Transcript_16700/m.37551 type:complete len:99 (-) Transcript_16700:162-458(-)
MLQYRGTPIVFFQPAIPSLLGDLGSFVTVMMASCTHACPTEFQTIPETPEISDHRQYMFYSLLCSLTPALPHHALTTSYAYFSCLPSSGLLKPGYVWV